MSLRHFKPEGVVFVPRTCICCCPATGFAYFGFRKPEKHKSTDFAGRYLGGRVPGSRLPLQNPVETPRAMLPTIHTGFRAGRLDATSATLRDRLKQRVGHMDRCVATRFESLNTARGIAAQKPDFLHL